MVYRSNKTANINIGITMLKNIAFIDVRAIGEVCPKLDIRIIGKSKMA